MLFGKKKARVSDRLETVIGQNAYFNGHLRCEGNLRIDGRCEGTVEATGNIVIGEMSQSLPRFVQRMCRFLAR